MLTDKLRERLRLLLVEGKTAEEIRAIDPGILRPIEIENVQVENE